jgi:hypothetical protein
MMSGYDFDMFTLVFKTLSVSEERYWLFLVLRCKKPLSTRLNGILCLALEILPRSPSCNAEQHHVVGFGDQVSRIEPRAL